MKICWDNLEEHGFFINKKGYLTSKKDRKHYTVVESCAWCGEPFLVREQALRTSRRPSIFCTTACATSYRYRKRAEENIGKRFGTRVITRLSDEDSRKFRFIYYDFVCDCGKTGSAHLQSLVASESCGCQHKENLIKIHTKTLEEKIVENDIVPFSVYGERLTTYDNARLVEYNGFEVVEVPCAYCGKFFRPSRQQVFSRLYAINNIKKGECRFYCSDYCKSACPTFKKHNWAQGQAPATSREVQPELRQMVLERDNWTCQYGNCGKTVHDAELHCHHFEGIWLNPIESADLDMCITFCKKHHILVHKQRDCRYFELSCAHYLDK
jgi:hypothetical protein